MKLSMKIIGVLLLLGAAGPQAWAQAEGSKEVRREDSDPDALVGTIPALCNDCMKNTPDLTLEPTKAVVAGQFERQLGGAIPKTPAAGSTESAK